MLTQERLIRRLNQLTLRYNLTWFDIEFDADKAINKINNFMGTKYPPLSDPDLMGKGPEGTYSITTTKKKDGVDVTYEYEIIKEEYFHSVIIPYIAMEVLARDEEFTTIYNKYATEMQEGLYDMFQKEFNSVPFDFRQNPGQGVFFGLETAQGIIQHNERNLNIPTFKFKVNYYLNNSNINISDIDFTSDGKAYVYDEVATIQYPNNEAENNVFPSIDGQKIYSFAGWTRVRITESITGLNGYTLAQLEAAPITVTMHGDLNLYAFWTSINTLTCTPLGVVSITADARPKLFNLIIPEVIGSVVAKTIKSNFITNPTAPNPDLLTQGIYLPKTILDLQANAFDGFKGHTILLNQGLTTIRENAFANTPSLFEIVIPDTVTTIEASAFPVVNVTGGKRLIIKTRILEINRPAGWAGTTSVVNGVSVFTPTWYVQSADHIVEVIWGYNG